MLKVQRAANGEVVFTLSGRMNAENVAELKTLFASEGKDRRIVLDLKDLTLVDRDAIRLLESCEQQSIALRNCPAYVREWMTRDRGDREHNQDPSSKNQEKTMTSQITDPNKFDIQSAFGDLLKLVQLRAEDTEGSITFTGEDPILPSKHKLGAIMSLGMMGAAAATQILYRVRGGEGQDLSVDLRSAVGQINPLVAYTPKLGGIGYQLQFGDPRVLPGSCIITQLRELFR